MTDLQLKRNTRITLAIIPLLVLVVGVFAYAENVFATHPIQGFEIDTNYKFKNKSKLAGFDQTNLEQGKTKGSLKWDTNTQQGTLQYVTTYERDFETNNSQVERILTCDLIMTNPIHLTSHTLFDRHRITGNGECVQEDLILGNVQVFPINNANYLIIDYHDPETPDRLSGFPVTMLGKLIVIP